MELDQIYHADAITFMDSLPAHSIDMIMCDPPYGTTSCAWDYVIPPGLMWTAIKRVIKPRAPVVLTASNLFTATLMLSNPAMYKHRWIWVKGQSGSFQNAKYMPLEITEDVLVFGNGRINYYPVMRTGKSRKRGGAARESGVAKGLKGGYSSVSDKYFPTNVLYYPNSINKVDLIHPTQKPVPLFQRLIEMYSKPGEIVLDFCMGSGTTALAARNIDRRFLGCDNNLRYVEAARERYVKSDPYRDLLISTGIQHSLFKDSK